MNDIPETFWPLLAAKIRELAQVYQPVTTYRLYPFLASHLPPKMVESALMRAAERGLIAIDVIEARTGPESVQQNRTVRLV